MTTPEFLAGATVITWHVDYWDYLGYEDPYGKSEHTRRQQLYRKHRAPKHFGTPQIAIANEFLPWEKGAYARVPDLIAEAKKNAPSFNLVASIERDERGVVVHAELDAIGEQSTDGLVLRPVLLLREARTDVTAGENEGKTLTEWFVALTTAVLPASQAVDGVAKFHLKDTTAHSAEQLAVAVLVERVDDLRTLDSWFLGVAPPAERPDREHDDQHMESALAAAGDNAVQLERFLKHYEDDEQKSTAARWLVENMEGKGYVVTELRNAKGETVPFDTLSYKTYAESLSAIEALEKEHGELEFARDRIVEDLATVTAEFLIRRTDQAIAAWRAQPASRRVDFDTFLNHVLPYRGSQEPLDDWIGPLRERTGEIAAGLPQNAGIDELYRALNKDVNSRVKFNERFYLHPTDQSFGEMLESGQGRCEDITNMITYAARSAALATAADYTPWWAHRDNNHAWNVLLDQNGVGADKAQSHAAKIYRKTFAVQRNALAFQLPEGREAANRFMASTTYVDVTDQYRETKDVGTWIISPDHALERFAYLCVFNGGEWKAIQWAPVHYAYAKFAKMGRDILYLPALHDGDRLIPANAPLTVDDEGERWPLAGKDPGTSLLATSTKPRQKSAETGEVTPISHLTAGTEYTLKRWADGDWVDVATVIAGKEPLRFDDLPEDALYWLVAKDSRRLERPFTIQEGRQRFW